MTERGAWRWDTGEECKVKQHDWLIDWVDTPTRPPLNRSTSCLGRKGQVAILENSAIWRHTNVNNTRVLYTGYSYHMIREFEGELSGVLMERICRQWAEWWQMTSSSFVSPLDCLTSFLGISLSRAVSSFGRITNVPKLAITAES